jgi:DNA-directed RNA polymerase specialized sigma subunit
MIKEEVVSKLKALRRLHEDDSKGLAFRFEVLRAISLLPLTQRLIIKGLYFDGLRWVQVSRQVGYSVRQCRNIHNKAIDFLLSVLISPN